MVVFRTRRLTCLGAMVLLALVTVPLGAPRADALACTAGSGSAQIPLPGIYGPQSLAQGPDEADPGNVRYLYVTLTAKNKIAWVDPGFAQDGTRTFTIKGWTDPPPESGLHPHRIIRSSHDQKLYFSNSDSNQIGQLAPGTHLDAYFPANPTGSPFCHPIGIDDGSGDGKIWVADFGQHSPDDTQHVGEGIGFANVDTGAVQAYPLDSSLLGGRPQELAWSKVGTQDWEWFSARGSDWLGRFTFGGTFDGPYKPNTSDPQLQQPHVMVSRTVGDNVIPDGKIWFTDFGGHAFGRIAPSPGGPNAARTCTIGSTAARLSDLVATDQDQTGNFFDLYMTDPGVDLVRRIRVPLGSNVTWPDICNSANYARWSLSPGSNAKGIAWTTAGTMWFTEATLGMSVTLNKRIGGIAQFIPDPDPSKVVIWECTFPESLDTVEHRCEKRPPQLVSGGELTGGTDTMGSPSAAALGRRARAVRGASVGTCVPTSHAVSAEIAGSVVEPDAPAGVVPVEGSLQMDAVTCDSAVAAAGDVTSLALDDPNLSFAFASGGEYSRTGPNFQATARGDCTVSGTLYYPCEIAISGLWIAGPTGTTASISASTFTVTSNPD